MSDCCKPGSCSPESCKPKFDEKSACPCEGEKPEAKADCCQPEADCCKPAAPCCAPKQG